MVDYQMVKEKVKKYADGMKGLSRLQRNCKVDSDIQTMKRKYKQTETVIAIIEEMKKLIETKPDRKIKK